MSSVATADRRLGTAAVFAVVLAACLISMFGFGIRASFGLYLEPLTVAKEWPRETFALAMAIQNLLWGIGVPVAGAIADRWGPGLVIAVGAVLYGMGVAGMAVSDSGLAFHLTGGLLAGTGVAFTSFSLALASIARVVSPERRSLALGFGTSAGSLGQVIFSPISQALIANYGWYDALVLLSFLTLVIIPLAFTLPSTGKAPGEPDSDQTMGEALGEAMNHRGFVLLTVGFFVCGFHVAFMTTHFPAYVTDIGLPSQVGAYALSIVGLVNIAGAFLAGAVGQRFSKKSSLAVIYFCRSVVIAGLLVAPVSEITIYVFAFAMGFFWLSTVPLTTAIVGQIFGLKFMATLFGVVFFSHQIGSFLGVWLGGVLYDRTGSYDMMWWAGIFFGVFAAIVHMPIDEKPLPRLALRPAT
ncbi:MAG: MFS transporter [Thiotrichales bacterium]|nr:MFS transporter [Thiotrichales bacterium]